jgi:transposase
MRRHHWNRADEQKVNLNRYLERYPVLKSLYEAKQRLTELLLLKTLLPKADRRYARQLLALLEQFAQSPSRSLAETLNSWLHPIVRMWRFSKSNGITEGFHTKMEMISRRAFGFRNFENYRMRGLAQCGWNGLITRV